MVFYDLTTIRIHGEAELPNDIRQYGLNKETGGVARHLFCLGKTIKQKRVLGVVQSAEGLPLMHTVHAGNVSEAKTLKAMLDLVLKRFAVERVIVVADRGLLSVDNVKELTDLGVSSGRKLQFILAVPARRYSELGGTLEGLDCAGADSGVTAKGASETNPEPCPEPSPEPSPEPNSKKRQDRLAEGAFLGHRLIVSHDPTGAAAQSAKRRARIKELTNFAETLVKKLDAQDALAEKKASAKKANFPAKTQGVRTGLAIGWVFCLYFLLQIIRLFNRPQYQPHKAPPQSANQCEFFRIGSALRPRHSISGVR